MKLQLFALYDSSTQQAFRGRFHVDHREVRSRPVLLHWLWLRPVPRNE